MSLSKLERRQRIKYRIRKVVNGTAAKPRLSVFRSNRGVYAQLIDDSKGTTIVSASTTELGKTNVDLENSKSVGKKSLKRRLQPVFKRSFLIETDICITVILKLWQKAPEKVV